MKINTYGLLVFFLAGCSTHSIDAEKYLLAYENKIDICDSDDHKPNIDYLKNASISTAQMSTILGYQFIKQWHDCVQPERENYKKVLEANINHLPEGSEYHGHLRILLSEYKTLAETQTEYDQLPTDLRTSIEKNKVFSKPFNIIEVGEILLPQPAPEE